jgi:hypothetical protein
MDRAADAEVEAGRPGRGTACRRAGNTNDVDGRPGWWPGKWDRFLIPKPFAWCAYATASRISFRAANDAAIEQHAREVERILNDMTAEIDVA